jgi:hypothetical protein
MTGAKRFLVGGLAALVIAAAAVMFFPHRF